MLDGTISLWIDNGRKKTVCIPSFDSCSNLSVCVTHVQYCLDGIADTVTFISIISFYHLFVERESGDSHLIT